MAEQQKPQQNSAKPALPQQQGQTPPVAQHAAGTPIPVTPQIRDWASI